MTVGLLLIFVLIGSNNCLFWSSGITYQLYTKLNPVNGQPLNIGNFNSMALSNFDSSKPTRYI